MILLGALAGLVVQSQPTVGDTIWLNRTVAVPPGHVVRASDWDPADPVELLGRPRIVMTGDSARISYPVVVWASGSRLIELPGPLLLGPGGTVDSLPGEPVRVAVKSVLPRVLRDSSVPPQPRARLVTRRETSLLRWWCSGHWHWSSSYRCTSGGVGAVSRCRPLRTSRKCSTHLWRAGPMPVSTGPSRTWPRSGFARRSLSGWPRLTQHSIRNDCWPSLRPCVRIGRWKNWVDCCARWTMPVSGSLARPRRWSSPSPP